MPFLTGFKNKDDHLKATLPERAETEILSSCGVLSLLYVYGFVDCG